MASDIPGNRAIIEPGHKGLLFPIDDTFALADALVQLLDDAPLRRRLGEAVRARMIGRHEADRMAQGLSRIVAEAAGRTR